MACTKAAHAEAHTTYAHERAAPARAGRIRRAGLRLAHTPVSERPARGGREICFGAPIRGAGLLRGLRLGGSVVGGGWDLFAFSMSSIFSDRFCSTISIFLNLESSAILLALVSVM